ncbi:MAG: tetratricopeptide (TPR) repeat protein [Planctomycetota bacterium]|jgi:tetratricopeptide (TPR) repeat protein
MSFQGDVRGIGLAELLQGLARGRKEGVLALTGDGGQSCVVGLRESKVYLLASPKEDPETWRERSRNAFAGQANAGVDHLRMGEVAHAERTESLYKLLDGGGASFRFDPGEVSSLAEGGDMTLLGPGTAVEFILLEYARIDDELQGCPEQRELPRNTLLQVLDPGLAGSYMSPQFLAQVDGNSTLQEIADRNCLPIRTARLQIARALRSGGLRQTTPTELLQLAIHELRQQNYSRAAQRLEAWCRDSEPGALLLEQAEALSNEWAAGRLPTALNKMQPKSVRRILRRMDHALGNLATSVIHWTEIARQNPREPITQMHRMAVEFREDERGDRPVLRDILDLCGEMRDKGNPRRTGPLLVIAAHKQPEGISLQLELGLGLVDAGRGEDAVDWIMAASRDLLSRGQSDRALAPLRQLLGSVPACREARALMGKARRGSTSAKKLRKGVVIGVVSALAVSSLAVVQITRSSTRTSQFREIEVLKADPEEALALLNRTFNGDETDRVKELRRDLESSLRLAEQQLHSRWMTEFHAAHKQATVGDPIEAIQAVRALPAQPSLSLLRPDWPKVNNLFPLISASMKKHVAGLEGPKLDDQAGKDLENSIERAARTLRNSMLESEHALAEVQTMLEELDEVIELVAQRRKARAGLQDVQDRRSNIENLSDLLRQAEAAVAQGDYARGLRFYDQILDSDLEGNVRELLAPQVSVVRLKQDAIDNAQQLAKEGSHVEALTLLAETFEDPARFMLPWTVSSVPSGATVRSADGKEYTTPFERWTTAGEVVELHFMLEGYEESSQQYDQPGHRKVYLSRKPGRDWESEGRIDAVPVPLGNDYIVADRSGTIVRLGAGGQLKWTSKIETISGIARAPVFLPDLEDHLLLVTEEGAAWLLNAMNGILEGPWDLGSPPQMGPIPDGRRVKVGLANGTFAFWQDGLKPLADSGDRLGPLAGIDKSYRFGSESGMQVVRRRENQLEPFKSRFGPWLATIDDQGVVITAEDGEQDGFIVLRQGEWEFMAFEPASPSAPGGRLWLSDGRGLRAFPLPRR